MSLKINLNKLTNKERENINENLFLIIENDSKTIPNIEIQPFDVVNNDIFVPFYYGVNELKYKRPERKDFPSMNTNFEGELRPEQIIVKKEALENLSEKGCTLLSLHPGYGKCLGLNTPIIMYDGTIKMVQDIISGELIMGDDSTPRKILNTCKGNEQMYKIELDNGENFICNESHILSLKSFHNSKEEIFDISVKDYIKLPNSIKKFLKSYKVPIDFPEKKLNINPYIIGYFCNSISPIYKYNSKENRLKLLAGLIDNCGNLENDYFVLTVKKEKLFDDIIYLARSLGFYCYKELSKIFISGNGLEKIPSKIRATLNTTNKNLTLDFKVIPVEETDYYGFTIDGNHRFLLGDFTVTHNTILSINLACSIKLKSLIIVNKIVLIKQWEESILKFCPTSSVQKLTSKSVMKDCDFYIMNAMNIQKMGRKFYQNIGLCIVDEVHLIMANTLAKSLQYICPRYLIGLSATPYRYDGLDKLLDIYFGEEKITREMSREHIVYKINTGIEIEMELCENTGKVNWGAVLNSQSENKERNNIIIKIVKEFDDRNFIILCKRVEQANYLFKNLKDSGEYVDNLIGSKQDFDRNCRILVGIHQKVGTGFDWAKADALMLATDLDSYFIQALGRIFRKKDITPIVFDLVDKNFILSKHFKNRVEVYEKIGGKIVSFNKKFPGFF